ncbi:MAG: DUF91 domain-containing protein [Chloroflexi bacterium]|nr:DUF91 domain-containing protein [Chloroflexota bacterium]
MDDSKEIEGFESLPLRSAYKFLEEQGFTDEATQIRESKDSYKSYSSTLKRGKIVVLLEQKRLLQQFVDTLWHFGRTEKGKSRIRRYQRIYDGFIGARENGEEEEEESAEETAFAYEDNLRDYLARNPGKIEPGLKLFVDSEGKEGVEYPVDAQGRKVDILALDKNNLPVVVELKVSRGHERVIGQALYYKNRVREIIGSAKARVVIVAREITPELKVAVEGLADCELFEYELSVNLKRLV